LISGSTERVWCHWQENEGETIMNGIYMHQFQLFDGEVWELVVFGPYSSAWVQQTNFKGE
jgi:hypothetical protein